MKVILAQPAIKRFRWELEVLLTNIADRVNSKDVVLLFSRPRTPDYDESVAPYLAAKYGVSYFEYDDNRFDKSYIPSIRPWLWTQYLLEDPSRELETYWYIDSDVIFREWPDLNKLQVHSDQWYGSDCSGYIALPYILQCKNGPMVAEVMAGMCGITVEQMKDVPGIGAHMLISNPTAEFWQRAYDDSNRLYGYLNASGSNIQAWTAEMWAQLWGMVRCGIEPVTDPELDFCMSTDPIEKYDRVKIMHNNGVHGEADMFFKGRYVSTTPFGENFDYVNRQKCNWRYVQAIEKVMI